mgnify:CR=1 FL=1
MELSALDRVFYCNFAALLRRIEANFNKNTIAIESTHSTAKLPRILFIDVLRAYAVMMMLQGHFTDTLLSDAYRDYNNPIYAFWSFFRGMTAPIFFFSAGLIFTFLLLKDGRPLRENERVKKGIRRAFMLIGLAYLLRFNINALVYIDYFQMEHYHSMFGVDVLHCMGLALLSLIGVYALHTATLIPLPRLLAFAGLMVFFISPDVFGADWSWLPLPIAAYFMKSFSVFTVIPWVGFSLLGGLLGYVLHKRPALAFTNWLPAAMIGGGLMLHFYSTKWFKLLHVFTGWDNFLELGNYNYLFIELGHAITVAGIIMLITPLWKRMPALVTKIGSETLTIYTVHYIILYGALFGYGLSYFFKHSLTPLQCVIGAVLFEAFFIWMVYNIEILRKYWQQYVVATVEYIGRATRVLSALAWHRAIHHQARPFLAANLPQVYRMLSKSQKERA